MGRITIFSIDQCNFCRRTKAALSARDIPFVEIDIESFPSRRADMISLTDRTTVPQVFFNEEHVGGSDEALAALARWDEGIAGGVGRDGADPRAVFARLIGSMPDPTDERLSVPRGAPDRVADVSAPRAREVVIIGDRKYTTLDLTRLLVEKMPQDSLSYWGYLYYNAFKGSAGTKALQDIFHLGSTEEAVQLGARLQREHYLYHVCEDHTFGDNQYYFRLRPFQTPRVLNSFLVWKNPVDDEPMNVIHRLGKLWGKLESNHLNKEGMVDDAGIRGDDMYWKFEEEVCELQGVSLGGMADAARKAFVINLYNLTVKYAFCKVGIPARGADRSSFYGDVSIDLGGREYSLDDLEHGVLRANNRHPYQLRRRFGMADPRGDTALDVLDPRIHFALNCGARSCPPVKRYTAEAIDEELRLAAAAFCEPDDNVAVDVAGRELRLSKLLHWYMSDFAKSKHDLPEKIAEYMRGGKREKLEKMIEGGNIAVNFMEYDWSTNNTNSISYVKGNLAERSFFPHPRHQSHPKM